MKEQLPLLSNDVKELIRQGVYTLYTTATKNPPLVLMTDGASPCCNPNGTQRAYELSEEGQIIREIDTVESDAHEFISIVQLD